MKFVYKHTHFHYQERQGDTNVTQTVNTTEEKQANRRSGTPCHRIEVEVGQEAFQT